MTAERNALFAAPPHTWTLPLAPDRWGYLQLPSRCIDDDEWEQLMVLLQVFKPGLVTDPPSDSRYNLEVRPIVGRPRGATPSAAFSLGEHLESDELPACWVHVKALSKPPDVGRGIPLPVPVAVSTP